MHEMGIALDIYRICHEEALKHGGGTIERVRIAIGELSAIEPDLIDFAWLAVRSDKSDAANATLDIKWCKAKQFCHSCKDFKKRSEGTWLRICPDCGEVLQTEGGDELDVLEITIEQDD